MYCVPHTLYLVRCALYHVHPVPSMPYTCTLVSSGWTIGIICTVFCLGITTCHSRTCTLVPSISHVRSVPVLCLQHPPCRFQELTKKYACDKYMAALRFASEEQCHFKVDDVKDGGTCELGMNLTLVLHSALSTTSIHLTLAPSLNI